jgi:GAF domain-containing protein/HAMP domain-containing protein
VELTLFNQIIQYVAWLLALVQLTLVSYIWAVNPTNRINRLVGLLLLSLGLNSYAIGLMIGAKDAAQAFFPTILLASTSTIFAPIQILITLLLFAPHRLEGRFRWISWVLMSLFYLPAGITILDVTAKTNLYFTGVEPGIYHGGYALLQSFTGGVFARIIVNFYFMGLFTVLVGVLLYFAFLQRFLRNRQPLASGSRLAWLLLVMILMSAASQFFLPSMISNQGSGLVSSAVFGLAYSIAGSRQMFTLRRGMRGKLATRLVVLTLAVALPLFTGIIAFVSFQAGEELRKSSVQSFEIAGTSLASNVNAWLELNDGAMQVQNQDPTSINLDAQEKNSIELTSLNELVASVKIGEDGYAFLVDQENRVVAHPNLEYTSDRQDFSTYPPVTELRKGIQGFVTFVDDHDQNWQAFVLPLKNSWGVIVQQPQDEYLAPVRLLQRLAVALGLSGFLGLALLVGFTTRQSLQPVQELTRTAEAISSGNLSRTAIIESQDELGMLAAAFNQMTAQLRELISGLETRVAERTRAMENRSEQLQAAAQVARQSAAIHDQLTLLNEATQLISRYFNVYHAGIFLIDDLREFAVLRATNSEGGQRMLARGHKLPIGQVGIVGFVAESGRPRIALDVGADAVFFNNPDLPQTRSEIALPLIVRGQIIGVLDVQSVEAQAFSPEDVETLQILADQIALAIENARLLQESKESLEQLNRAYGEQTQQSWVRKLKGGSLAYKYDRMGVSSMDTEMTKALEKPEDKPLVQTRDGYHELVIPITLRNQPLGVLRLRRESTRDSWSQDDVNLAMDAITQIVPAIESAHLLEETQSRVAREQILNELVRRLSQSLDLDALMQLSVKELAKMPDVNEVSIQLAMPEDGSAGHG